MTSYSCTLFGKILLFFLSLGTVRAECSLGWIHYNDSCYFFSTHAYNWFTAQASCSAHHGKLAEPENKDEMNYLISIAARIGGSRSYWLGARDDVNEGIWQWSSTDNILKDIPWAPGEPNSDGGDADCLEMLYYVNWKWNDRPCTHVTNFICERSYQGDENEIIG